MECKQLIRLLKDWYFRVKQETMAPARMMQFVDQHVKQCAVCRADLLLPDEIGKIREFVLPESKNSKPPGDGDATPDIAPDEDEEDEEGDIDDEEANEEQEDDLSDDDVI
ncbi:MAG: hypothetical protein ACOX5Z_05490 [Desulfobulbus sp.]|jgi:hypothetical protein